MVFAGIAVAIFLAGVLLAIMFHVFYHKSVWVRWGLGVILLLILWQAGNLLLAGVFFSPLLLGGIVFGSFLWRRLIGGEVKAVDKDPMP